MLPSWQTKVGNSAQSVFTVPSGWPAAGTSAEVRIDGVAQSFARTSATQITLRTAARPGSIVDGFQIPGLSRTGLIWQGALDFPSVAAGSSQSLTVTLQGAEVGDLVTYGLPSNLPVGLTYDVWVSAANTVTVRASNLTAAAIDPPSGNWRIKVSKE